jgi:hypothetical protein
VRTDRSSSLNFELEKSVEHATRLIAQIGLIIWYQTDGLHQLDRSIGICFVPGKSGLIMIRHLKVFQETDDTASCSEKEKGRVRTHSTYLLGLYVIFLVMAFVQSPDLYFDGFRKQVQCSQMKGYAGHSTFNLVSVWAMQFVLTTHKYHIKLLYHNYEETGGNGTITIPQDHRITDTESVDLLPD